jgi:hypothetical protein
MVSQSVIGKSKELAHPMEMDPDLCPTDMVEACNQDEGTGKIVKFLDD